MYNQGDIVIVPFPFSDLTEIKQRPVLVLSKTSDNNKNDEMITCGITSNLKNSTYSVLIENKNLLEGTIPKTSRIKLNKLFTINQEIVIKKVARLNKDTFEEVKKEFYRII